jgi:hypothetical protein
MHSSRAICYLLAIYYMHPTLDFLQGGAAGSRHRSHGTASASAPMIPSRVHRQLPGPFAFRTQVLVPRHTYE